MFGSLFGNKKPVVVIGVKASQEDYEEGTSKFPPRDPEGEKKGIALSNQTNPMLWSADAHPENNK